MSISIVRTKWWDESRDKDLVESFHPIPLLLSAGWNEVPDTEGIKAVEAIDELLTEAPKGSKWKITVSKEDANNESTCTEEIRSIFFTRAKWWDDSEDKDLVEEYHKIDLLLADEGEIVEEETIKNIKAINEVVHKSPEGSKWRITVSKEDSKGCLCK